MRKAITALGLALSVALAGCGGDGSKSEKKTAAPPAQSQTAETGSGSLWVTTADSGEVYKVNPGTGKVEATIKVGEYPADVAVSNDAVWVANATPGDVSRIDPATNKVTATIDTEDARGLAVADDAIWVSRISSDPASVISINPADNTLGDPIPTGGDRQPESLAWDNGVLYAEETYAGGLMRIDTASKEIEHLKLDQVVTDVDVRDGQVYVAGEDAVFQVDPASMKVSKEFKEEERPWALAPDETSNSFWVALQSPTVKKLDLDQGAFASTKGDLGSDDQPYDIAFAGGSVWVVDEGGKLYQVDPASLTVKKTIQIPGASGAAAIAVG